MRAVVLIAVTACSGLQRSPPPADSPVVAIVASSACSKYRLTVHLDGVVEYTASDKARIAGTGWTRVSTDIVDRVMQWDIEPAKDFDELKLKFELTSCGFAGGRQIAVALRKPGAGWRFRCAEDPVVRESQLLALLDLAASVQPTEHCSIE